MTEFRLPLNGEFGHFLKRARKAKYLTLMELSELSGVSEGEICRIEKNKRTPNVLIAGKLEDALRNYKRCPRCGGNLFVQYEVKESTFVNWCLQCAYRGDLKSKREKGLVRIK